MYKIIAPCGTVIMSTDFLEIAYRVLDLYPDLAVQY